MGSGIKVSDECIPVWNEFKTGHKYRYVLFDFAKDLLTVVVEKKVDKSATYDDFLDDLPPRDVRYAVYDYHFKVDDGTDRNKLVFVIWAPGSASVKRRMLIASTKQAVKSAFAGISIELQATDDSEISEQAMLAKVLSMTRN
jgi:cofilin